MNFLTEITDFLTEQLGERPLSPDTDLFTDMGVGGDDFDEMMEAYSQQFGVDMKGYLWYFHTDEEGMNLGGIFFPPPNARVQRIPVTPHLLAQFAQTQSWDLLYPPHELPARRPDLSINRGFFVGVMALLIIWLMQGL